MSDFIIGHVTDSKEGPMDGVYAETKGTYTKFKGTGVFRKEKRILHQKVTDVGIKASLQTGMVSINDRNRNQAIAVSITEMVAVLNEALRYGTAGKGKKVRLSSAGQAKERAASVVEESCGCGCGLERICR